MITNSNIKDTGGVSFSPSIIKSRLTAIRDDPKKMAVFQWNVVRYAIYALAIIIAWQFVKVLIGFNTGSSSMTMLGRLFIVLALVMVLGSIYEKAYKPFRARFLHVVNMPDTKINKIEVFDADKSVEEIDKTLNKFNKVKGGN